MLAYNLHTFGPDLIHFSGNLGIHWYGLAYVLGFYCCYLVLHSLSKRGYGELKPDKVADFITMVALFGVVLGGRLGYMLLYDFDHFIHDPKSIFFINQGGMASHGGIFGIVIFTWIYARKQHISWTGLGDNLVVGAPIGLFFGRLANFINGELYGRITNVSWAWKFPTEIHEMGIAPSQLGIPSPDDRWPQHSNEIIALAKKTPDGMQKLVDVLHPRHPSQLYEAALEGVFLFSVLYFVRTRSKNLPNGLLTALFFLLYAVVRITVENFREPDPGYDLYFGFITKGQLYSFFMIATGLAFLIWSLTKGRRLAPAS
jgi:phosphatidylglycerol---prolipoprotein diacylglyceryl transferase